MMETKEQWLQKLIRDWAKLLEFCHMVVYEPEDEDWVLEALRDQASQCDWAVMVWPGPRPNSFRVIALEEESGGQPVDRRRQRYWVRFKEAFKQDPNSCYIFPAGVRYGRINDALRKEGPVETRLGNIHPN